MVKKLQESSSNELLLDTTYLLPFIGIEVEGIEEGVYAKIVEKDLHFPSFLVPELVGVIVKEAKKRMLDELPKEAIDSFNSIIFGEEIKLISPEGVDLEIAYKIIKLGWTDIFDAVLYATGKRMGVEVLSLDRSFRNFLKKNGFDHRLLLSHKELFE